MTSTQQNRKYRNLNEFLKAHVVKDKNTEKVTHTRIGNLNSKQPGEKDVYPAKYNIPDEELDQFYKLYERHVFVNKNKEYLTEVQLQDGTGPLLVDLDFRYDPSVKERKHGEELIKDLVETYSEKIVEILDIKGKTFNAYVFEKPNVNVLEDMTKDGVHLVFDIQMDHIVQQMIRTEMLSGEEHQGINGVLGDLDLKNTYNDVLDKCISTGKTNWQLYGSCKPGHERYDLTHHFKVTVEDNNGDQCEFTSIRQEHTMRPGDILRLATARKPAQVPCQILDALKIKYNNMKNSIAGGTRARNRVVKSSNGSFIGGVQPISFDALLTYEDLQEATEMVAQRFERADYSNAYQAHRMTMALAELEKYTDPYDAWIKMGWALKNTHPDLFLTWMLFSSHSPKFNFEDIPEHYERWTKFNEGEGLTSRSIAYWCRTDAPQSYDMIHKDSVDYYVERCFKDKQLNTATENDVATLLYFILKDEYRCVIETNGSSKRCSWYSYKNHRWQDGEGGVFIRSNISSTLSRLFTTKSEELFAMKEQSTNDKSNSQHHVLMKTAENCNKPSYKDGVMKEAAEIFYTKHPEYKELMNTKRHLFGFTNGVADMEKCIFRPGEPEDYLTLSCNVPFVQEDDEKHDEIMTKIHDFFSKLFPDVSLREYIMISSHLLQRVEQIRIKCFTCSTVEVQTARVRYLVC